MIPLLEKLVTLLLKERDLLVARKQYTPAPLPPPKMPPQVTESPTTNETPVKAPDNTPPQITLAYPFPPKVIACAQAIKYWEGSIDATNPGNMKYSHLTASWGATRGRLAQDGGNFAVFKSPAAGFTALCHFLVLACQDELTSYHNARTLDAFLTVYAGNPPQGYKDGIAQMIGVPLSTDISTFL